MIDHYYLSHYLSHRCDVIAVGIVNAVQNFNIKKPIIIRLQGTNVEQANMIIEVLFVICL